MDSNISPEPEPKKKKEIAESKDIPQEFTEAQENYKKSLTALWRAQQDLIFCVNATKGSDVTKTRETCQRRLLRAEHYHIQLQKHQQEFTNYLGVYKETYQKLPANNRLSQHPTDSLGISFTRENDLIKHVEKNGNNSIINKMKNVQPYIKFLKHRVNREDENSQINNRGVSMLNDIQHIPSSFDSFPSLTRDLGEEIASHSKAERKQFELQEKNYKQEQFEYQGEGAFFESLKKAKRDLGNLNFGKPLHQIEKVIQAFVENGMYYEKKFSELVSLHRAELEKYRETFETYMKAYKEFRCSEQPIDQLELILSQNIQSSFDTVYQNHLLVIEAIKLENLAVKEFSSESGELKRILSRLHKNLLEEFENSLKLVSRFIDKLNSELQIENEGDGIFSHYNWERDIKVSLSDNDEVEFRGGKRAFCLIKKDLHYDQDTLKNHIKVIAGLHEELEYRSISPGATEEIEMTSQYLVLKVSKYLEKLRQYSEWVKDWPEASQQLVYRGILPADERNKYNASENSQKSFNMIEYRALLIKKAIEEITSKYNINNDKLFANVTSEITIKDDDLSKDSFELVDVKQKTQPTDDLPKFSEKDSPEEVTQKLRISSSELKKHWRGIIAVVSSATIADFASREEAVLTGRFLAPRFKEHLEMLQTVEPIIDKYIPKGIGDDQELKCLLDSAKGSFDRYKEVTETLTNAFELYSSNKIYLSPSGNILCYGLGYDSGVFGRWGSTYFKDIKELLPEDTES